MGLSHHGHDHVSGSIHDPRHFRTTHPCNTHASPLNRGLCRVSVHVRIAAVTGFILLFYYSSEVAAELSRTLTEVLGAKAISGFLVETARLGTGVAAAWLVATLVIRTGVVNRAMMRDTYIAPLKDFFRRYGLKSALLLLLLVGVYRISDIVLGVIANVFYQDMSDSPSRKLPVS